MKILMNAKYHNEPLNSMVREGKIDVVMNEIMESQKPEVIYFTEVEGHRGAMCVIDINDQSQLPSIAEPYFLNFDAECHFTIAMSPQDLKVAGLNEIGKKWNKGKPNVIPM